MSLEAILEKLKNGSNLEKYLPSTNLLESNSNSVQTIRDSLIYIQKVQPLKHNFYLVDAKCQNYEKVLKVVSNFILIEQCSYS